MNIDLELDPDEAKQAIQWYLREKKDIDVDQDDINFRVKPGTNSSDPRASRSPHITAVECNNIEH